MKDYAKLINAVTAVCHAEICDNGSGIRVIPYDDATQEQIAQAQTIIDNWIDFTPWRRFSKLAIGRGLNSVGKLTDFLDFLDSNNARFLWDCATELDESYPEMQALLPAIPVALGLTQEQVDQILNSAEIK